ncbi:MAG: PAS domain S-box-containing protein [Halobacteriales archaeon]|jgi:PAS domain S-box-containing protein
MNSPGRPIQVVYVAGGTRKADDTARFLEQAEDQLGVGVSTPVEGIDRVREETVDCVLADYDLPDTDGIEFLRRVRETDDGIPSFLLVRDADEGVLRTALNNGSTDCFRLVSEQPRTDLLANRIVNAVAASRTSAELDARKDQLDGFRNQSLVGTFLLQDGAVRWVNQTLADLTGYAPSDLEGASPLALIAPENRDRAKAVMDRWRTGEMDDPVTLTGIQRDGVRIDLALHGTRTTDGGVPAMVGVASDLTQREALEREVRRFRHAVESAGHAIYITDVDGTIEYANPAFEEITGYPVVEAVGRDPKILKSGEMGPEYYEQLYETLFSGAVWEEEIVNERRSGDRYTAHQTIAPVTVEDEITAFVAIQTDITERKERERALERQNERLEEFASMVSHDLRNPLSVAIATLENVRENCDADDLDVLDESLDRMGTLIDDVLTMAREGQVVTPKELEPISLDRVATSCSEIFRGNDAMVEVASQVTVRADEGRLRQVFENLYRNSIEHAGDDVTVRVGTLEDGFYVEDDGQGIPPEQREQIFQSGHSTTDDGTGFGLAIVAEIVEAHGWDIAVTEGTDGGARFEITGTGAVD